MRLPSSSSAGSQYTPCTGPAASQVLRVLASASAACAVIHTQNLHARLLQPLRQRVSNAAFVWHKNHATAGTECHPCGFAKIKRWTQIGDRYAPRNAIGGIETEWERTLGDGLQIRRGRHRRFLLCWFLFLLHDRRARSGLFGHTRLPVASELNHVSQGGEVAQLEILVARNVVRRSHGREHLCLFDGVDAEVCFEVEIQIQHVFRVT